MVSDESYGEAFAFIAGAFFVYCQPAAGLEERMAREWAKSFYNSDKWRRCKYSYIQSRIQVDGGMCEECQEKPGYIVHHKNILTPDNIGDAEISLNHSNLEYVCKDCHDLFEGHGLNKGTKPLCVFDADGQPISLREIDRCGIDTDVYSPP